MTKNAFCSTTKSARLGRSDKIILKNPKICYKQRPHFAIFTTKINTMTDIGKIWIQKILILKNFNLFLAKRLVLIVQNVESWFMVKLSAINISFHSNFAFFKFSKENTISDSQCRIQVLVCMPTNVNSFCMGFELFSDHLWIFIKLLTENLSRVIIY